MDDYVPNNGIVIVDSSLNSDYTPNVDAYGVAQTQSQQLQQQDTIPASDSILTTSQRLGQHNNQHLKQQQNGDNSELIRLGDGQIPRIPLPNLDEMEEYLLPLGYTAQHVLKFIDLYTANCAVINF